MTLLRLCEERSDVAICLFLVILNEVKDLNDSTNARFFAQEAQNDPFSSLRGEQRRGNLPFDHHLQLNPA